MEENNNTNNNLNNNPNYRSMRKIALEAIGEKELELVEEPDTKSTVVRRRNVLSAPTIAPAVMPAARKIKLPVRRPAPKIRTKSRAPIAKKKRRSSISDLLLVIFLILVLFGLLMLWVQLTWSR